MPLKTVPWSLIPVEIPGVRLSDYSKEFAFQIYCADWLRKQYELTKNDAYRYWHHSANERSCAKEGFTAKMMGQAKGFPDFVSLRLKLAIELKCHGNIPSPEQSEWLEHCRAIGWYAEVVYSADRFKTLVAINVAQEN